MTSTKPIALFIISLCSSCLGFADSKVSPPVLEIRFEHHNFSPLTLQVPANTPLEIKIVNLSAERIEFESFSLNREKVVEPGKTVTLKLPVLRPGSYDFVDDFHDDVPAGVIIAK
jgi:hypothetical protein